MVVVNLVEKFGADGFLERSWDLPPDVVEPLRAQVNVTLEGWIVDVWPMTPDVAALCVSLGSMSLSMSDQVPGSSVPLRRSPKDGRHRSRKPDDG